MVELKTFKEAIDSTEGQSRTLLLGNGFSSQYFRYQNLLDNSELELGSPIRNLFERLQTSDFEEVVQQLECAATVGEVYGDEGLKKKYSDDAKSVRSALVRAINATHPAHVNVGPNYNSCLSFLRNFTGIFTLNYDLLLYWTILKDTQRKFSDGFGLGDVRSNCRGPFKKEAHCNIYNLHGGLHLFQDSDGSVLKALNDGEGVIATITNKISVDNRMPLYVAEGSSSAKMRKINTSSYLRHCYDQLSASTGVVFVFGHSAAENDAHIYRAIFSSRVDHVFFGVYQPDDEKLAKFDAILGRYKESGNRRTSYSFYNVEDAHVWDADGA